MLLSTEIFNCLLNVFKIRLCNTVRSLSHMLGALWGVKKTDEGGGERIRDREIEAGY